MLRNPEKSNMYVSCFCVRHLVGADELRITFKTRRRGEHRAPAPRFTGHRTASAALVVQLDKFSMRLWTPRTACRAALMQNSTCCMGEISSIICSSAARCIRSITLLRKFPINCWTVRWLASRRAQGRDLILQYWWGSTSNGSRSAKSDSMAELVPELCLSFARMEIGLPFTHIVYSFVVRERMRSPFRRWVSYGKHTNLTRLRMPNYTCRYLPQQHTFILRAAGNAYFSLGHC